MRCGRAERVVERWWRACQKPSYLRQARLPLAPGVWTGYTVGVAEPWRNDTPADELSAGLRSGCGLARGTESGGSVLAQHGLREAALLAEPVLALVRELFDAVVRHEGRRDPALSSLLGDCLGPVLTELGDTSVPRRRVWPRATPCSRPAGLAESAQSPARTRQTHLLDGARGETATAGMPAAALFGRYRSTSIGSMSWPGAGVCIPPCAPR